MSNAARETAGAGLGSLSTRQVGFAVEGQKVVTVRGWQARLYARTSQFSGNVEFCTHMFSVGVAGKIYRDTLAAYAFAGEEEASEPEEANTLPDLLWFERRMRSAAIA